MLLIGVTHDSARATKRAYASPLDQVVRFCYCKGSLESLVTVYLKGQSAVLGAALFLLGGVKKMTMWLPKPEILLGSDVNPQSIFLTQLWHELLSGNSPDSFRAKALDLPLLLEELLRICEYAQKEPQWLNHVQLICAEIRSYRLSNPVPTIADSALNGISNFTSGQSLPRLMEQVRIYLDLQQAHFDLRFDRLRGLAPIAKQKKRIAAEMSALATHIQARGGTDESLEKIGEETCMLAPENVIDHLCGDVNQGPREYACYITIAAERSIASSLFANLEFLKEVGSALFGANEVASTWYKDRPEGIVVECRVSTLSRQKAADAALAEVSSLINLHALYANNVLVAASPKVLVSDGEKFTVVEVTPSKHFGLRPRRFSEATSRERYEHLHGRLNGRLANLLESHAFAVSASDARSAVFHLWTALETLASGVGTGSIGERVADVVAPIVAWKRIDKIMTYLAISANELRFATKATYDLATMPYSTKRKIDPADILKGVAGVTHNPTIEAAFSAFSKSPLLLFRLYRAWEECNNPIELKKILQLSRDRIKWQVMRFYRTRNLLVHYGEVDNLATRLLENAQYYLSTCVARVLHDLTAHDKWTVQTSLEFQRYRFETLLHRLDAAPNLISVADFLDHPQSKYITDLVWPADEKK